MPWRQDAHCTQGGIVYEANLRFPAEKGDLRPFCPVFHLDGLAAALAEPFDLRDIPTAEDKPKRWEKAQAQALDLLDAMDGSGKYKNPHDWGAAFILAAMPETMEHFGENL